MTNLEDFELEFQKAGWANIGQAIAYLAKNYRLLDFPADAVKALRIHPDVWDAIRFSAPFKSAMASAVIMETLGWDSYVNILRSMHRRAIDENARDGVNAAKFIAQQMAVMTPKEVKVSDSRTFRVQPADPTVAVPKITGVEGGRKTN